jgi:hypothetical protein
MKTEKGDYIWTDINKTQVKWESNPEGRFIIGCDPYYALRWWDKILIWLRFKKEFKPPITFMEALPKDYVGTNNIKIHFDLYENSSD